MDESRRRMLKAIGLTTLGGVGAILLSSYLIGPESPIREYMNSVERRKELVDEASPYGDDGDRVAYAIDYLGLSPGYIPRVIQSWDSLTPSLRAYIGGSVPTPTAAIVADELSSQDTAGPGQQFPNLLWSHAHTNALFAFPWVVDVKKGGDPRLVKMADLRLSEGPAEVQGQRLTLYYPENGPQFPNSYGKRRYVREGFAFFAGSYGSNLEGMDPSAVSIITEQSTSAAVTIPDSGMTYCSNSACADGYIEGEAGETCVFFNTADIPLYCFSEIDNSVSLGSLASFGALAVGMNTMKSFREKHPNLIDSSGLSLAEQGYVQLDDVFMADPSFQKYLYPEVYPGYFAPSPVERTFAWKEYQTVGLVPEQTVRGLGVATIGNFHPANFQPLSMLERDPSIVELLVQNPEIYVPSRWNQGYLFEPFD